MAKRGIRKRKNRPRKRTRKNRILSEVGRDENAKTLTMGGRPQFD
jgi:hypothetical protein